MTLNCLDLGDYLTCTTCTRFLFPSVIISFVRATYVTTSIESGFILIRCMDRDNVHELLNEAETDDGD